MWEKRADRPVSMSVCAILLNTRVFEHVLWRAVAVELSLGIVAGSEGFGSWGEHHNSRGEFAEDAVRRRNSQREVHGHGRFSMHLIR
jgi:hypothetical protein